MLQPFSPPTRERVASPRALRQIPMPMYLSKIMFELALNSTFRIHLEGGGFVQVKQIELREGPSSLRQEQFAILFQSSFDQRLAQGLYTFDHDTMGEFDLFIVPIGMNADGFLYEAVFNRLINQP